MIGIALYAQLTLRLFEAQLIANSIRIGVQQQSNRRPKGAMRIQSEAQSQRKIWPSGWGTAD
jgi:hypothetical protein